MTTLDTRSQVLVDQAVRAWRRYRNLQSQLERAKDDLHSSVADLTTDDERAEYYRRSTTLDDDMAR